MEIGRKKLPHETPVGIPPEDAIFFLAICADKLALKERSAWPIFYSLEGREK